MVKMYDPPSGWRYGFPKEYRPIEGESVAQTLVRDGYPRIMAEDFGAKHCRFWDTSERGQDSAARLAVEGCHTEKTACGKAANDNLRHVAGATGRKGDPWAKDRGPYITTYTGRFYFNDPRPEDFEIEDIAHSLAMTRRYSGHGQREYTTAEHSVHIYRWLTAQNADADTRLAGLLHDAPESLSGFGDAASPRKKECPQIKKAEDAIWDRAIAPKFDLPVELPMAVHHADKRICHDEMTQNLWEVDPSVGPPLGVELEYWGFDKAKAEFLRAFREIRRVRQEKRRVV